MNLIQIDDNLIVAPSEIRKAERCGNYTSVYLKGHELPKQIWDDQHKLWDTICQATLT